MLPRLMRLPLVRKNPLSLASKLRQRLHDIEAGPFSIDSKFNNIHQNLALENWLFNSVRPSVPVFLWWRNKPTIVIGRHQNPWRECDVPALKENNVNLARRTTGGGAVYQDFFNSCFSFISTDSVENNNDLILQVLKDTFHIQGAKATGRNDLVLADGRKFSGAAFRTAHGLGLHHGTLLFNTDLEALSRFLTPNPSKLQSNAVSSVRSRVANLCETAPTAAHDSLTLPLTRAFSPRSPRPLVLASPTMLLGDSDFAELHQHHSSKTWNWGSGPGFIVTHGRKFDWGLVELQLEVAQGKLTKVDLSTDALRTEVPETLLKVLAVGSEYTAESIRNAAAAIAMDDETKDMITEVIDWLELV